MNPTSAPGTVLVIEGTSMGNHFTGDNRGECAKRYGPLDTVVHFRHWALAHRKLCRSFEGLLGSRARLEPPGSCDAWLVVYSDASEAGKGNFPARMCDRTD